MPNRNFGTLGLADVSQSLIKPRCIDIKWFTAFDAWELDRTQYKVVDRHRDR